MPDFLVVVEVKLSERLGPGLAAEALELLAVDPEGIAEVQAPPEDGLKDFVQVGQFRVVGHADEPDDHRADIAQHGPQGQALERERGRHPPEGSTIRPSQRSPIS